MERIRQRLPPPPPTTDRPHMSGFVRMRQTAREWRMKTWYCVLFNAHVCWFTSKRDAQVAARLQGQAHVAGARVCAGAGRIHVYPHAFEFTARNGRVFFCSAPTEDEQQRWVESLNAVVSASPSSSLPFSSGSDSTGSSHSSLPTLECSHADEDAELHSVSLSNGPNAVSFRQVRTTERLELTAKLSVRDSRACFACDAEFSALRRRRHACGSCARSFCRWHCATSVILDGRVTRVCDACAQLQHFTAFVVAITATVQSRASTSVPSSHVCVQNDSIEPLCHRQQWHELRLVTASPASFTALNLMCLLHKYQREPWLFARALCLFIPVFETDPTALGEYWVQFLGLFVPLVESAHPPSSVQGTDAISPALDCDPHEQREDEQQASLHLFLDLTLAICRRSTWFALRTVWESFALFDDAQQRGRRVCANYVLLLIYLVSAFGGDSEVVANTWLREAPETQADALVAAMDELLRAREAASAAKTPRTLVSEWMNASRTDELQRSTQRVVAAMSSDGVADATDARLAVSSSSRILALFSPVPGDCETLDSANDATLAPGTAAVLSRTRQARVFNAEVNFVHNLTAIAERLRPVTPASARTALLPELLRRLQQTLGAGVASLSNPQFLPLGHDILVGCNTVTPTILRVVLDEGKVFSTRCRAPTLIVFEALAPTSEAFETDDSDTSTIVSDTPTTAKPPSRPMLGRQDSEMLDRMLCSFDKKHRPFSDEQLTVADNDDLDSAPGETDDDVANEAPPVALATEDARLVYEESTAATLLTADTGLETWDDKTRRLQAASDMGKLPGWTLASVIAKSFDDVRQEVFALQLMSTLQGILDGNGLGHLYLRPYKYVSMVGVELRMIDRPGTNERVAMGRFASPCRILCTGANAGLIETLTDAFSLDAVKKQHGSLARFFTALFGSEHSDAFCSAQQSFVASMAASSVFCYLFQVRTKDSCAEGRLVWLFIHALAGGYLFFTRCKRRSRTGTTATS